MAQTIVILSALEKESAALLELPGAAPVTECGVTWATRELGGARLAVAWGGMGTTNAAASAQLLVERLHPDALVFSGIAGSLNARLGMGDVVVGERLERLDADMGIVAESAPWLTSFPSDASLVRLAERELAARGLARVASVREADDGRDAPFGTDEPHAPRYVVGTVATSDLFSTEPATLADIREATRADCEEMEGAAAAQVCARAGVPFLAIRSISNVCGEAYEALDGREADLVATARLAAELTLGVARRLAES